MAVNRQGLVQNLNLQGGELFAKQQGENNFSYFGATNEFKINYKSTMIEHKNTESSTTITDLEVVKEVEASLSFTTEDLNKEVLAIAFGGNAIESSQTAGTATEIVFSSAAAKNVYELGKHKVSNVVVEYNNGSADVEAVLDTDYSLNAVFGTIEIAESGILVGEDVTVTFDNEAETIINFSALDNTSREFSLRFLSAAQNGQPKQTTIHRVRLSLNGDYDLKSLEKFTSLSFTGKVLKDTTKPDGKQFVETVQIGA